MTDALDQAEARIRQVLAADKLCGGQVTGEAVRTLAAMMAEPEPNGDVLAEREACAALIDRLAGQFAEVPSLEELELRRPMLAEAARTVRKGLHRGRLAQGATDSVIPEGSQ